MDNDGFTVVNYKSSKKQNGVHKAKQKNTNEQPTNTTSATEQNKKRILCNNIVLNGKCPYGNKCMYAHSIGEQQIDKYRKKAYDIIRSSYTLNDLTFSEKWVVYVYENLLQMTQLCFKCAKGVCFGGYNCKNGVSNESDVICYNDFVTGLCTNEQCGNIHLTKRGLVPYKMQYMMHYGINKIVQTNVDKHINDIQPLCENVNYDDILMNIAQNTMIEKRITPQKLHDDDGESDSFDSDISESNSCDEMILTFDNAFHT